MPADFEKYRSFVDHFELDEDGKRELVNQVWAVMENAVDRAFISDPTQRAVFDARESLGHFETVGENVAKRAFDSGPVVDLSKAEYQTLGLSKTFNNENEIGKGAIQNDDGGE